MGVCTVRVPATTANLGPGFDTLGLALRLHNQVTLEEIPEGFEIEIEGEGKAILERQPGERLVSAAARETFKVLGHQPRGLRFRLRNQIPIGRGLGSSAADIIGGVVAAFHLAGRPLNRDLALQIAGRFERHPDNITPALLGGFTVAGLDGERVLYQRFTVDPSLKAVVLVPDAEISTYRSRKVLPEAVPFFDAVFNLNRTALLVSALVAGNFALLREATRDRLHQPYRETLLPGMQETIEAGFKAGALGCFLSGSGSCLLALVTEGTEQVGARMREVWRARNGSASRVEVLEIDNEGAKVVESTPSKS